MCDKWKNMTEQLKQANELCQILLETRASLQTKLEVCEQIEKKVENVVIDQACLLHTHY